MKSASCSQPPLWNDRLLFLRFNPSSFLSIFFFPKTIFLSTAMQQCGVLLGWFFSGKIGTMQFYWKLMSAATQPQPSQGSLETLRSLHWHHWATQRLTSGMHLNSSCNCLPSKLRKTEQNFKRWPGFHKIWFLGWGNGGCFIPASGNTTAIKEKNRPRMWLQCCIPAKPRVPVLQSGTCGSPTHAGISTKTNKLREGSGLRGDFIWAGLHWTHADTPSKPTCTIQVTWGRSSPRAATSFKINKEITLVQILWRYQQSEESSGMALMSESNWLCK